jgi:VWFA-related protein
MFLAALLFMPAPAAMAQDSTQPGAGAPPSAAPQDPVLVKRPPARAPVPPSVVTHEGRIQLDVVVTNGAGSPVPGLQPWDFTVLDEGQPRKILSFRSFDGVTVKPEPPVEVILVLDMVNLPFQQVAFVRAEVEKFLKRNGGHLAQPVSIILFTDAGIRMQPRPSVDGNALAEIVSQIKGHISSINPAMGAEGDLQRFQRSVHQMANIAENEARRPGRKLLVWVGPGWPMLDAANFTFTDQSQRSNFEGIVELSTKLREARMAVYSVAPSNSAMGAGTRTLLYQDFLKGVKSPLHSDSGNLALKVIVTQSGGRIFGPDNDLAGQIDSCVADANAFYRLSFDPPPAGHADEYHDLKVQVSQSGLTVRTNTGYYDQP